MTELLSDNIGKSHETKENQEFLISKDLAFERLTLQSVNKLFEMLIFALVIFYLVEVSWGLVPLFQFLQREEYFYKQ